MPVSHSLRVHSFEPSSRANGPGLRAVLWLQGCTLACPGCFNPQTHSMGGGEVVGIEGVLEQIRARIGKVEGLTISGGEPLLQRAALTELLRRLRMSAPLSIVVFTGFEWQEVQKMPGIANLLDNIDVLIAGRYRQEQRVARSLTGSANKTYHFLTGRYTPADFEAIPTTEVILSPGGEIHLSGIDPLKWQELC